MKSLFIKNNGSWYLLWALAVVILDQVTKYLVKSEIGLNQVGYNVTSFFSIVHVHNEGAAFSFLASQSGWQRYFFITVSTVISLILLVALLRTSKTKRFSCLSIALIIGGAIGNLIDRALLGYVEDFLLFYVKTQSFSYYYPAFNVADIAVCTGAGILLIIGLFGHEKKDAAD
ncbi:MAG: signal peptidase II [Succinivibrio sp.]